MAISAHGLLEQVAGDSGTRLGHGRSAGAGWKGVGSEAPAEHLAQALGQELGKFWFRQMPAHGIFVWSEEHAAETCRFAFTSGTW